MTLDDEIIADAINEKELRLREVLPTEGTAVEIICWVNALLGTASALVVAASIDKRSIVGVFEELIDATEVDITKLKVH